MSPWFYAGNTATTCKKTKVGAWCKKCWHFYQPTLFFNFYAMIVRCHPVYLYNLCHWVEFSLQVFKYTPRFEKYLRKTPNAVLKYMFIIKFRSRKNCLPENVGWWTLQIMSTEHVNYVTPTGLAMMFSVFYNDLIFSLS